MNKFFTLFISFLVLSAVSQAQITIVGADGRKYTVYTKAQQDLQFATKPAVASSIDSVKNAAVTQSKIYCATAIDSSDKKIRSEIVLLKQRDTIFAGQGIRFDSIAPNKVKAVPQVYWDPASASYKRNW